MVNGETRRATEAGAFVVYTQDWHPASTPHFAKDGGIWPVHCVAGTWGAELHPDLSVRRAVGPQGRQRRGRLLRLHDARPGRPARRSRPSSRRCSASAAIERVVVVGLATDYCVSATALDAARLGFATEVLQDAIAAVDLAAGDGDRARGRRCRPPAASLGYCFGTPPLDAHARPPRRRDLRAVPRALRAAPADARARRR